MLVHLVVFTVLALIAPQIFPNVKVRTGFAGLMVAVVFGFLNVFLGWAITAAVAVIPLPASVMTGGLSTILLSTLANGVLLKMTDGILKDFEIKGWLPAFGMGLLFAIGGVVVRVLT